MKLDKNYCWQLDGSCRNIFFSDTDIYEFFRVNGKPETVRYVTCYCGCRADKPCYYVDGAIERAIEDRKRWNEFFKGSDLPV